MDFSNDKKVGICSWSLGNDPGLIQQVKKQTGCSTIHLHIRPELGSENLNFINSIIDNGWSISCTMVAFDQEDYSTLDSIKKTGGIVPDDCWLKNKQRVFEAIDITNELGVKYLSFHFGFVQPDNIDLINKTKQLADYAHQKGVMLLMETGQETAAELAKFLEKTDHPALSINFDPANMILYGKGDPSASLDDLFKWVKHIHIKDATASDQPGQWGKEVPWSHGQVNSDKFLSTLLQLGYYGAMCVEREQGSSRVDDVVMAIQKVGEFLSKHAS